MKKITTLITILISNFIFSQTIDEKNKIIGEYNKDQIDLLLKKINTLNVNKAERIQNYFYLNPEQKKKYTKNSVTYIVYDIIDNEPVYISNSNRTSSLATKTNTLYPGGSLGLNLEGIGMNIGVWEIDYPLKNHVEFLDGSGNTRITNPDTTNPNPTVDFHATHVMGTVGAKGVNGGAKGMAPKSTLLAYNNINDQSETVLAHFNTGMLISNHSYGIPVLADDGSPNAPTWMMGCYNTEAQIWDQIAYDNPYYLKVTSGGNSGNSSYTGGFANGFDKLTSDKNAKNSLIIASASATVHPFLGNLTSLNRSTFSSQGPTDDGRIKPDITGRGENVFSTINGSTTSYGTSQGTSMSSPNVAGSLLLLQEHYNNLNSTYMKSSTLRALVCHTAMDDAETPTLVTGSVYPGPDPYWGWGFLNTEFAAETITDALNTNSVLDERTLSQGQTYSINVNVTGNQKLIATIAWTDPAGVAQDGQLNSTLPALVNDLDIRIEDSSNNIYYPWKLDINQLPNAIQGDNTVDNIEKIEIDTPTDGLYTITISHKGNLTNSSQDYALVITGSDLTLSTEEVSNNDFIVWPNPATDKINFKFNKPSKTEVKMFDMLGRSVYNSTID
ncbi:MAG TPA: peptidase S8, partial [Flavobacteriaceae bacterium]|nr:peptidase S8 [Flavobacteriaceae bacterium]